MRSIERLLANRIHLNDLIRRLYEKYMTNNKHKKVLNERSSVQIMTLDHWLQDRNVLVVESNTKTEQNTREAHRVSYYNSSCDSFIVSDYTSNKNSRVSVDSEVRCYYIKSHFEVKMFVQALNLSGLPYPGLNILVVCTVPEILTAQYRPYVILITTRLTSSKLSLPPSD